MMERKEIWKKIKDADQNSRQLWKQWQLAENDSNRCALLIRQYIREKFLMTAMPKDTDSIYELGRRSFVKLQEMKANGLIGDEINTGCSGASTEIARKALFFMVLQRDLNVTFLMEDIAKTETVSDIVLLCQRYKRQYIRGLGEKDDSKRKNS